MAFLLQFCGFSDPLQLFYLEQHSRLGSAAPSPATAADPAASSGPVYGGFRPFQLDDLLAWAQAAAQCRGWDLESIQRTVLDEWMVRAEVIRQWQLRLQQEPQGRLLVAGLGTAGDWRQHCEQLLQV